MTGKQPLIHRASAVLAVLGLLATSPVHAGIYLGAGAGLSEFNYSDVDLGTGNKGFIGAEFNQNWGIELSYIDTGEADIDNVSFDSLAVDGLNTSLVYASRMSPNMPRGYAFLKGGFYNFDTELTRPTGTLTTDSSNLSFGIGAGREFASGFRLIGEIEAFLSVEDFADDETVAFYSVSLAYGF